LIGPRPIDSSQTNRDVVPKVTIVPPIPSLSSETPTALLILRFANPLLDVPLPITLSILPPSTARLLTPEFTLPPKQDEQFYEIDEDSLEQTEWGTVVGREGGMVRRRNWVVVGVELGSEARVQVRMRIGEGGKLKDNVHFAVSV